ncbi:hypothetical protein V1L54_25335 [Streptomyces sp. TRM 70361]|uniref:hypothetical protein n=1 Tax=Streptomyces sp. TRM 70361 TaxID=3116553 RepID=UPI002E7B840E|nr:hypothetical protein [Streptomyces sp. TRM 70361]MEE1942690.1 hypothetical protein [Streptomyces sp. TRM 70361]
MTGGGNGRGEDAEEEPPGVAVGSAVRDLRDGRVGDVLDVGPGLVRLRPLSGGREWEAAPDEVRPLSPREQLSARLAAANARSRHPRP